MAHTSCECGLWRVSRQADELGRWSIGLRGERNGCFASIFFGAADRVSSWAASLSIENSYSLVASDRPGRALQTRSFENTPPADGERADSHDADGALGYAVEHAWQRDGERLDTLPQVDSPSC